jgi:MoaA/NifB/PqqE/SkfB family radical SAM enzyme
MDKLRALRSILYSRLITRRPFFLSHVITARCNCRCGFCLWRARGASADARAELSAQEIKSLYTRLRRMGFAGLTVWGGEPLLRKDLPELIAHARSLGYYTSIITNGYHLASLVEAIVPLLDFLILSLDLASDGHDRIRGCPGLFARAADALQIIRRRFPDFPVRINTVLNRLNVTRIPELVDFAKAQHCGVIFQSMNRSDYGYNSPAGISEELAPGAEEDKRAFTQIRELKKNGYPVLNSYAYLDHRIQGKAFRCHYKKIFLRVEPDGEILDCTKDRTPLAHVRDYDLEAFFRSGKFREFLQKAENCNRCTDSGVIESSLLWALNWQALRSLKS